MKKNVFVFLLLTTTSSVMFGQKKLKVGDNSTSINPSAALEIESVTKGFLPPRLTSVQQASINNPATGLQVYCTDCSPVGLYSFNGSVWTPIGSLTGSNLANGNIVIGNVSGKSVAVPISGDITLTDAGVVTIGTNKVTNTMLLGSIDLATKVQGTLPIINGGTGATTVGGALTSLGAQSVSNLSTDLTTDAASITKYPAVKTIKDYVDSSVSSGAPDASASTKGKIQLAGDLSGTAALPTITNAAVTGKTLVGFTSGAGALSASDSVLGAIQKLDGNDALKAPLVSPVFTGNPEAPTAIAGDNDTSVATTAFVTAAITTGTPDATSLTTGKIKLGGDLAGAGSTAATPVITDSAITANKLATDAVETLKIKDANVTTAKIADEAITDNKIAGPIGINKGGTGAATAAAA